MAMTYEAWPSAVPTTPRVGAEPAPALARSSHLWGRDGLAQTPDLHALLALLSDRDRHPRPRHGRRTLRAVDAGRLGVGVAEHGGAGPARGRAGGAAGRLHRAGLPRDAPALGTRALGNDEWPSRTSEPAAGRT